LETSPAGSRDQGKGRADDFRSSDRSSLGIEMELEIVDAGTRELAALASEILAAMSERDGVCPPKVKHELMECIVEVNTDVCSTVARPGSTSSAPLRRWRRTPEAGARR